LDDPTCLHHNPDTSGHFFRHSDVIEPVCSGANDWIKGRGREVDVDAALLFLVLLGPKSQAAELYGVDAIPAFFIIDERGKIIYGDVSLDASVEFVLAQKLGLVDEVAAGA
jgi:hypothetical protein